MASSATPATAPPPPPTQQAAAAAPSSPSPSTSNFENPFTHNVALGLTPVAMFALFLPPRRLDLRQILLGGVALWGTNQLVYDYSGRSFAQRFNARMALLTGTELPEKAQRTQLLLRQERERRLQQQKGDAEQLERLKQEAEALGLPTDEAEMRRVLEVRKKTERGALEKIWMGDQGEDWKEKRDQREKEALSEGGGGYWGLITDQLSEVWNKGRQKEADAQAAEVKAKADAEQGKKP